ncbi:MAG: nucleoside deaminase [Rhizobiales bacterium]|nr:nucleoside deaminase [Hyphomicrobiales bacterium]
MSEFMDIALRQAKEAAERGEVPVGAAVVGSDGAVLAQAGNQVLELSDPSAHAELIAIRQAAVRLGSERLTGCDLYVTLEPCPMCAGAISLARVRRLYYGAEDPKAGGVDHGPRVFSHPTCHHAPEVYGGLQAAASSEMLKQFFKERR